MVSGNVDFRSFAVFCAEEAQEMNCHNRGYLEHHLGRFYETYKECSRFVPQEAKMLSVGAGDAYVEKQLARACGARVTVIDFPEAIQRRADDYRRYGFRSFGMNLAAQQQLDLDGLFDVVLSFEVVEHLPISPHQHLGLLGKSLKPGGRLILTTPNMAHLPNIFRLLRGRSILPDAQLAFSPVSYENEYIHRREYVVPEIVDAMRQAGLTHEKTVYLSGRNPLTLKGRVRRLYDLVPRWKKIMLMVGRKERPRSAAAVPLR